MLTIDGLRVRTNRGTELLRGVSYTVQPGETLGIVGESGSGKSLTVLAALGLLPPELATIGGQVILDGADLTCMTRKELDQVRGRDVGLVFQDAMTALNPVMRVGAQIAEGIRHHEPSLSRRGVTDRVVQVLGEVGIPQPQERLRAYPHQLSGGMRQRVVIAIAMVNRPKLLIADEPTSALDVTIQAQILRLLRTVQKENSSSLIMITHDLGVIAQLAQRVAVMYAGRVVEIADTDATFHQAAHPYTSGLLASLPRLDGAAADLVSIGGHPPRMDEISGACPFLPRCVVSRRRAACEIEPEMNRVSSGHTSACHFHSEFNNEGALR